MRRVLLISGLAVLLMGCSFRVPEFLGRQGTGASSFNVERDPLPDPVPVAMRTALVEPAIGGVIVRVEGLAPTQGYHSARLSARNAGRPDATGELRLAFEAIPPRNAERVGVPATRELRAALFLSDRRLKRLRRVTVASGDVFTTLPIR